MNGNVKGEVLQLLRRENKVSWQKLINPAIQDTLVLKLKLRYPNAAMVIWESHYRLEFRIKRVGGACIIG